MSAEFDIILLTHGNMESSIRCVKSLYHNTDAPFHLVVIDDSTPDMDEGTDLTPTWFYRFKATHDNITFVHSNIPYRSGIQIFKEGYKRCITPYVVISTNSITFEPAWDIAAFNFLKMNSQVGIVGLKCVNWNTQRIESAGIGTAPDGVTLIDIAKGFASHRHTLIYECDAVQGALVFTRREAVEPNLDGDVYHGFKGCEDIEICMAAREKGWKIYFCGMGVAYHQPFATRKIHEDEDLLKNYENKEIFAKRWGLWTPALKLNPMTKELVPEIKERDIRLPPVIRTNFRGEIVI